MVKIISGKQLTPQQFMMQWVDLPHQLSLNVWNFEVKAGRAAQSIFQKSFDLKRFNSSGSTPWPRRSSKSKGKHPLMVETSSLKNSIKWKHMGQESSPTGVTIYTDPNGFLNTKRHQGFCYAAVHNAPDSLGTRTGRMASMPQRQFMGDSSFLDNELKKLTDIIFQGFPK